MYSFCRSKSTKSKVTPTSKDKSEKKIKSTLEEEPEMINETQEEIERRLVKFALSIIPKDEITIFPNNIGEFIIKYSPSQRMKPFMEKVSAHVIYAFQRFNFQGL